MQDCLRLPLAVVCTLLFSVTALPVDRLYGQAGLREALEALDVDNDGEIEPEEITPLARPYLERIARARRISLDRDNDIERLQEAARIYHSVSNGSSRRSVRPEGESTVKPFGTDRDQPLIPEFGLPYVKFPYNQDDLDFADRTMRSHDRNDDGFIDRQEAQRERWTHRDPFADDLNQDDRLSRLELAQRYARRRLVDDDQDELRQKAWRTGSGIRPTSRNRDREDSQWWRRGGSDYWLTASLLSRFDSNRNGRLEAAEAQKLGIPAARLDVDRDGEISREELHAYTKMLQDEAGGSAEGLPSWFYELDADRDGQVAMAEFASDWTDAKLQQFAALDTNSDGLLTTAEVTSSSAMVGGSYHNKTAEVLPPRKTIISEIEVTEDYLIGDLNLQLSITHSNVSYLDGYLTGPDGQRIELFTEVGGSGDHFDQTTFDDQSRYPITKARAPFRGTYLPEGTSRRQPGLSHFNGKNIQGVWQLVIRGTRNERFGMLHSWSLIAKPQGDMLDDLAGAPTEDGPQKGGSVSAPRSEPDQKQEQAQRSRYSIRVAPSDQIRDFQEVVRNRFQSAVERGEMTEEIAKRKVNFFEEMQRKEKLTPETIEKYRQMLKGRGRSKESDKLDRKLDRRGDSKDPSAKRK